MPEVRLEVDIEVWCENCGRGICNLATGSDGSITVEPCDVCIEQAKEDGYEDGHNVGLDEGKEAGYEKGYDAGYEAGYDKAIQEEGCG